ncbi:hypothetical protein BACCOPRO_02278 [Phocaeicola coprophilus DSM 18228 = JCM 13818]|uniref:Uncharacterized protein n=1 Tax=Phocaeicola coprophilus DSM 18228 = JCM 13818 TaxID=547042 RepID=S0FAG5_9BACT|nr:hypothetical protein BACCOPRO_02278 [Phocaeicola coprophilus DSM 18228 = JCM 13818]
MQKISTVSIFSFSSVIIIFTANPDYHRTGHCRHRERYRNDAGYHRFSGLQYDAVLWIFLV